MELEFTEEALKAVAKRSFERKTGARGLRAIMESIMMNSMYTIPTDVDVVKCIITKEAAEGKAEPQLIRMEKAREKKASQRKHPDDEIA